MVFLQPPSLHTVSSRNTSSRWRVVACRSKQRGFSKIDVRLSVYRCISVVKKTN